jgi:hypothetical protein
MYGMKSLCSLILIVLIVFISACKPSIQESNIPTGVNEAFKTKYPDAQDVSWSLGDSGKFAAIFSLKKENYTSFFSSTALWILTEKKIKIKELPGPAMSTIKNGFGDYRIQTIKQVESPSLGKYYSIALLNGKEQLYLNLSPDGVILNFSDLKKYKN